jgi:hypothetical protein
MSYLQAPRLHFAGRFRADVSTVNNSVTHFRNPNQPPGQGWNPAGSGSWSMTNCAVTTAVYADGTVARTASDDPVIGASLQQSRSARLVDLDPEQQLVSQIWGMQLQLERPGGSQVFQGTFKVTAFSDLWTGRFPTSGQVFDLNMSTCYQSVLTALAWNDVSGSRFLSELRQASAQGLLSIKFNLDGFDQTQRIGRIVGTIGPVQSGEPGHFVVGHQCMGGSGPVWFFPAVVDSQRGKLIADFGNALQTTTFRGAFDSSLDLQIGLLAGNGQFSSLGRVPIGPAGWYEQTAGVCEFPPDRALTPQEVNQLDSTPIGVVHQTESGASLVAAEGSDGLHVRADEFVFRMSANDPANVTLRASKFGKPLPNAKIALSLDPSGLQRGASDHDVGVPANGLSFPASVTTDAQGVASFTLKAGSIGTPRNYIDGQVYGVRYTLTQSDPNAGGYFNFSDFISVLLWTNYAIPSGPTWVHDVEPILKEYEGLYPVMRDIVTLGNYDSVVANKSAVQMVFSLPEEDPRYMPVTRDLSPAKRQMILNWLLTTGNAGKPNFDAAVPQAALVAAAAPVSDVDEVATFGGKAAAMRHRRGAG